MNWSSLTQSRGHYPEENCVVPDHGDSDSKEIANASANVKYPEKHDRIVYERNEFLSKIPHCAHDESSPRASDGDDASENAIS
ncbi:hypothetical protein GE061_009655 [Apolygus lucorum]|uniref:Uncharacterized protein n=1 Tax=Apolygus lucorum TaxID=248454 RepID=A0A8S9WXT3_APOLU|nr:hypothetical protein GE061_005059 [Apolygus lucorum]KAF6206952.1 hypothetical protein GE061_018188 [Apolygus lucorum]KAF6214910.1 hypothetical protein GE061_009655 [Apolygus lucorum]